MEGAAQSGRLDGGRAGDKRGLFMGARSAGGHPLSFALRSWRAAALLRSLTFSFVLTRALFTFTVAFPIGSSCASRSRSCPARAAATDTAAVAESLHVSIWRVSCEARRRYTLEAFCGKQTARVYD